MKAAAETRSRASLVHRDRKLDRLTSLRAFAAFFVFLFHIANHGILPRRWPITLGDSGVIFFFVLSGFVLTWSHVSGRTRRDFYVRRYAKIYPMHLVMTAAAFLSPISEKAKTWVGAALSSVLLQAWVVTNNTYPYAGNSVSWTLGCEMFFYLCFPFMIVYLTRFNPTRQWLIALSCFTVTSLASLIITRTVSPDLAYHIPLIRMSEFLLGITGALAMRRTRRMVVKPAAALGAVTLGLLVARNLRPAEAIVVMTFPYLAVVMAVAGSELKDATCQLGGPLRFLEWRPLVYCGELSFAFYLVHLIVIDNLPYRLGWHGLGATFITFVIAGLLSVILHHGIEKPAMRMLVSRLRAGRPNAITAPKPLTARPARELTHSV